MIETSPTIQEIWLVRLGWWTILKDAVTLVIAGLSAAFAVRGYLSNADTRKASEQTRRAEFLYDLHKSFFEEGKYNEMREQLDVASEEQMSKNCAQLCSDEPEEFTRYLNFFEFVAYLQRNGNLTLDDVRSLLGYYLKRLKVDPQLYSYIQSKEKDYGDLARVLAIIN